MNFIRFSILLISIFASNLWAEKFAKLELETAIDGKYITVSGEYTLHRNGEHCYYLALNDPIKNRSLPALTRILPSISEVARNEKTLTEIVTKLEVETLLAYGGRPVFIKLNQNRGSVIKFRSHIKISDQVSNVIYDFYPLPLVECPNVNMAKSPFYTPSILSHEIDYPKADQTRDGLKTKLFSSGPVQTAGLYLEDSKKKQRLSDDDIKFEKKLKNILSRIEKVFHKDFPSLAAPNHEVVHAREPTGHRVSDYIVVNRKDGHIINTFQDDYLNWLYWAISTQYIESALIKNSNFYDSASSIKLGIIEYLNIDVLKSLDNRFNLINTFDQPLRFFRYNYLQALDNISQRYVNKKIRDLNKNERINFKASRVQLLLRQLAHQHSTQSIKTFISGLLSNNEIISERFFISELKKTFKRSSHLIDFYLKGNQWPDVKLESIFTQRISPSSYQVFIKGETNLPGKTFIDVTIRGLGSKQQRTGFYTDKTGKFEKNVVADFDPKSIYLLEDRRAFDVDRFNNDSAGNKLLFFPGSARTLYDDNYTVVWLVYPLKRPGEGLTLSLISNLYKYSHANYSLVAEKDTFNGDSYLSVFHSRRLSEGGASVSFSFEKNRQAELLGSIARNEAPLRLGLFQAAPTTGITFTAKSSQHDPVPSVKASLDLSFDSSRITSSNFKARFDITPYGEVSPQELNDSYFSKRSLISSIYLGHTSGFDLRIRGFRGFITGADLINESNLFRINDLATMRVRIDEDLDVYSTNSNSLNIDFNFPIGFLMANSKLFAGRSSQGRIFKDYGTDFITGTTYEAAGLGFILPIGGKLFNTGNVVFSKLTLLTVLEEKIAGETNNDPKLLFGVNGEL